MYIEAPHNPDLTEVTLPTVFLAGGITGCPDWQTQARAILEHGEAGQPELAIVNPRRADYPWAEGEAAARFQVTWEQHWLHTVDATLFWFPACDKTVTVQPIALYELGQALGEGRRIVVGVDGDYPRAFDVFTQCELARPGLVIHQTLRDTCAAARRELTVATW